MSRSRCCCNDCCCQSFPIYSQGCGSGFGGSWIITIIIVMISILCKEDRHHRRDDCD